MRRVSKVETVNGHIVKEICHNGKPIIYIDGYIFDGDYQAALDISVVFPKGDN
jgi:hypothetical protein